MSWRALLAGTAACACIVLVSAQKHVITVQDVLDYGGHPHIDPVWSPKGDAFVYESGGAVYSWHAGEQQPKQWFLTASLPAAAPEYDEAPYDWQNRRVRDRILQWFPNGKDVLLLDRQQLFIAREGAKPRRLEAPERLKHPVLSPDGKSVLYVAGSDLGILDVATGARRAITSDGSATLLNGELDWVYPEELDLGEATWWSPDSKHIAFLQFDISNEFVYPHAELISRRAVSEPQRYPQAGTPNARVRLGVFTVESGKTVWINAGNSPDVLMARVAWLPDSSALTLETMPRVQNALDLLFCDVGTGEAKTILHEQSKTWVNVGGNPWFLKGGKQFLWTSERDGFRHLYRYSIDGTVGAQLTAGDWELQAIAGVDEDAERVYFTSSEQSPLENNLYSMSLSGGKRTRITQAAFDHDVRVAPTGAEFVDESSNLSTPPETTVRDNSGKQLAVLFARDTPSIVPPPHEIVHVKANDGTLLYGMLTRPVNGTKPYPVIVHVYGGPGAQMVRNAWHDLSVTDVLANNGFLIWELDNRGTTGRGHAFEEPVFRNFGSVEVDDQRAGVEYLVHEGLADRNRVGVMGWSFGGYMTLRCLLKAPDLFRVGVAGAPVTDWHNYDTIYTERYMRMPQGPNEAAYQAAAVVPLAGWLQGKLLIQHALEDDNVLFQNTAQMVNALELADRMYSLQVYSERTHGITGPLKRSVDDSTVDFFLRNLR